VEALPEVDRLGPPREVPNLEPVITSEAELYLWDFEEAEFKNNGIVLARLCRKYDDPFSYWIVAATDEGTLLAHTLTADTNPKWSHHMLSLTWNNVSDSGRPNSWLFRWKDEDDYSNYMTTFIRAQWESAHRMPWDKIKVSAFLSVKGSEIRTWNRLRSKIML
jgi:hypothetical protein